MSEKHIWECKHSYYCTESNYFSNQIEVNKFSSFSEFLEDWGASDKDYNLLFRWDWEEEEDRKQDDNYRSALLKIFFMIQRKGYHLCCEVQVCRNDETEVKKFLEERFEHLMALWSPFNLSK
jgi:hypothetical protein